MCDFALFLVCVSNSDYSYSDGEPALNAKCSTQTSQFAKFKSRIAPRKIAFNSVIRQLATL